MKLITIHQPNYLPWAGFFHKWMISDAFIILDTVQYHKNEWQNRNRIKTPNGAQWLTVPVTYRFPQSIAHVGIAPKPWARKQIASIEQSYAKAPYLDKYWPELKPIFEQSWENLCALNVAIIRALGGMLACETPLLLASDIGKVSDDPTLRLIELCKILDGTAYLSGSEGRNYLQPSTFQEANIELYFQQVEAPVYPQLHGDFISHLSVLDVLFHCGDSSIDIIRNMGGKTQ
ncbi:MAG: WbqC family protein [Mariprofundaceae bacterium]|nr:WbqC family protein [Mariprofundaceae bacterium]